MILRKYAKAALQRSLENHAERKESTWPVMRKRPCRRLYGRCNALLNQIKNNGLIREIRGLDSAAEPVFPDTNVAFGQVHQKGYCRAFKAGDKVCQEPDVLFPELWESNADSGNDTVEVPVNATFEILVVNMGDFAQDCV